MKICLSCQEYFDNDDWQCPACQWQPQQEGQFTLLAPHLLGQDNPTSDEMMYKAANFAQLAQLETDHFWFLGRNKLIIWMLEKYATHAQQVLEIGCGTGFVLSQIREAFPEANLSAGDIYPEGLVFAAERVPNCQFLQIDARQMPFKNEFDVIGMFDVIEHITEDEPILTQLREAIKPEGIIILTVPQHPFLWSYHDEQAQHKRRYKRGELEQKARNVGLEIVRSTSFVSLLLPLMILQRQQDISHINTDEWHQHLLKVNPWANRIAKILLGVEFFFIRLGFSFPVGGSRLVVLRRV